MCKLGIDKISPHHMQDKLSKHKLDLDLSANFDSVLIEPKFLHVIWYI